MPDYNQMRVNPSSKPPKPTRPKDPPARTQKDEFIIEGSGKAGKSGKGLSTQEVMDIADIAVKLFNSKKYPTLYDDATLRERNRTEGAPSLRMSFQPTYDGVELATDIASNPTPVGIGIAVAKQLLKLDIMGEVEAQIANTRQIQLHEEDRHRDIASAEQKKREIEMQRQQSKNKVVFGDLQKRLSSSLSVRTNSNVEVPKVSYENLKKYLEPPKIFKEADNTRYEKIRSLNTKPLSEQRNEAIRIINNFKQRKKQGVWKKITPEDFANELLKIVLHPKSINQAKSNNCGIATACKAMAQRDPVAFTNFAISLYENGVVKQKSGLVKKSIKANLKLLDKLPTNDLNSATYVLFTSIRNSYNFILPYDPEIDSEESSGNIDTDNRPDGLAGFTYPRDIVHLCTNFSNLRDISFNYTNKIDSLIQAIKDGNIFIVLLDFDLFRLGVPSTEIQESTFGNHYIQILDITKVDDKNLEIVFWTWGENYHPPYNNFTEPIRAIIPIKDFLISLKSKIILK